MATCEDCKANNVCDHNKFGFENCGNYIPKDVAPKSEVAREMSERLKAKAYIPKPYGTSKVVDEYDIDQIVKEFAEG